MTTISEFAATSGPGEPRVLHSRSFQRVFAAGGVWLVPVPILCYLFSRGCLLRNLTPALVFAATRRRPPRRVQRAAAVQTPALPRCAGSGRTRTMRMAVAKGSPFLPRLACACLALAIAATGQARPAVSEGAQAQRLVRFLELPERRSEAWRGLLHLRAAAAPPLAAALQDPRPDVVVRAAWVLGLLGPDGETAIPALQRGSKGKDADVAYACEWALQRITFRGTLVVDYSLNGVEVFDAKGESLRRLQKLSGPWFAELTTGGNLLLSEFGGARVREVDVEGKDVWAFTDVRNPYHVQRLPNGNTMISDAGQSRVVEVDRAGKVVWECKDLKRPVAAERLPDGHTLICEQEAGRVHEVDAAGRVVFEVADLNRPQRAQRLPNGNTLIAVFGSNEVVEVDPRGMPVRPAWKVESAQMARRRSDGHTLVAATQYWAELDADGKELWRKDGQYAVGILRQ